MRIDRLKEIIKNLVEEIENEEEMDEATVTGNVDGYKTPHSFSSKDGEKKKNKRMADIVGYTQVNEAVKVGKSYGDWKVMDYVPVTYDDLGSANGGRIRLVNQNTMDTLLIQNDLALRGNTWWISTKGKRVQDKKPETVIQKAVKLNEDIKSELDRIKKGDVIIIKNPDVKGPDYNTPVTFIKYNRLWNSIIAKNKDGKIVKIGIENDPSNEPYRIIKEDKSWKRFLDPYNWFRSKDVFQNRFTNTHAAVIERLIKITEKNGDAVERVGKNVWGITKNSASDNEAVWQYYNGHLYYTNPNHKSKYDTIIPDLYKNAKNLVKDELKNIKLGDDVVYIDGNGNIVKGKATAIPTKDNKNRYGRMISVRGDDVYAIQIISINNKSLNEATNRYHQLRKDEGTPNQKIGKGIREMRKQIQEIEKFVEWYSKIKTESDLDSSQYWKRTQRHLNVIRERLNKISQKIQNLSA
jgi:hypothetical protein